MDKKMSINEMEDLLAALVKAYLKELENYKSMWPEPTSKQAKRIEIQQEKYDNACKQLSNLQTIKNRY